MNGERAFIDTNIFAYLYSGTEQEKKKKAKFAHVCLDEFAKQYGDSLSVYKKHRWNS